jgi:hypothetical protein
MRAPYGMKKITRAVTLEDVRDLAERPPRAYLSYVSDGEADALHVQTRFDGARWFVTLPRGTTLPPGAPVVLLIDDGDRYFELRGLRITGALAPGSATEFEVVPDKTIAWHYGTLRRQAT